MADHVDARRVQHPHQHEHDPGARERGRDSRAAVQAGPPGTDHVEIAAEGRKRDYERDDRVKIHQWDDATNTAGPFHNLNALFVALRGERAEIVLDIAGRAAKVTLDADDLIDITSKT